MNKKTAYFAVSLLVVNYAVAQAQQFKFPYRPYNANVEAWISSSDLEPSAERVILSNKPKINSGLRNSDGTPILEHRRVAVPQPYGAIQTKEAFGAAPWASDSSGYAQKAGFRFHTRRNTNNQESSTAPYNWSVYVPDSRMLPTISQDTPTPGVEAGRVRTITWRTGMVENVIPFQTKIEVKGEALPERSWAHMWITFHRPVEWELGQQLKRSPLSGSRQKGRNVRFFVATTDPKTGTGNQQIISNIRYKKGTIQLLIGGKEGELFLDGMGVLASTVDFGLPLDAIYGASGAARNYYKEGDQFGNITTLSISDFEKSVKAHSPHITNGRLIRFGSNQIPKDMNTLLNQINTVCDSGKGVSLQGARVKEVFQWYKRRGDYFAMKGTDAKSWSGFQGRKTINSNDFQQAEALGVFFVK